VATPDLDLIETVHAMPQAGADGDPTPGEHRQRDALMESTPRRCVGVGAYRFFPSLDAVYGNRGCWTLRHGTEAEGEQP
jgi:hypothetical protein